jgi:hypothetical protein
LFDRLCQLPFPASPVGELSFWLIIEHSAAAVSALAAESAVSKRPKYIRQKPARRFAGRQPREDFVASFGLLGEGRSFFMPWHDKLRQHRVRTCAECLSLSYMTKQTTICARDFRVGQE